MVKVQIPLDEKQHNQLESLAAQRSTSVSQLIREGVDRVLAAAAVETARRRHGELVDKKFTGSLSESESSELQVLEQDLDAVEAYLYQPALHRLHAKIEALESGPAK